MASWLEIRKTKAVADFSSLSPLILVFLASAFPLCVLSLSRLNLSCLARSKENERERARETSSLCSKLILRGKERERER